MANFRFSRHDSLLLVIDLQPKFLAAMWESDRVLHGVELLSRTAQRLGIPTVATEQNPERMGSTVGQIAPLAGTIFPKMAFSAAKDPATLDFIQDSGRKKIVVTGIETHICVAQTTRDLLDLGFQVAVCPDAVTAGSVERHKLGMEQIRDSGGLPAHTESIVYEWLETAEDPAFREVLGWIKTGR